MNPEKYEPKQPLTKIEQAEEPQDILTEQTNKYEFDQIEHELISKYQPKFLAKGGEHIIYEIPEHPDIVVKAETGLLEKIIEWNAEHGLPIDSLPEEFKPRIHEYLKQEATRHQELKKYFGADHVPSQKEGLGSNRRFGRDFHGHSCRLSFGLLFNVRRVSHHGWRSCLFNVHFGSSSQPFGWCGIRHPWLVE